MFSPGTHSLTAWRARWKSIVALLADPYRPERYYMRGPGPKWHAKHALAVARVDLDRAI